MISAHFERSRGCIGAHVFDIQPSGTSAKKRQLWCQECEKDLVGDKKIQVEKEKYQISHLVCHGISRPKLRKPGRIPVDWEFYKIKEHFREFPGCEGSEIQELHTTLGVYRLRCKDCGKLIRK